MRYAANCSLLFTEFPLLARPSAAKAAGFDAVEFWWPWPDTAVPRDRDISAFIHAVEDAGVRLVGLNFFAGDLAGPDCGILSLPCRSQEFVDNLDIAVGIGQQLGVSAYNALYGNRIGGLKPEDQDALARENVGRAAEAVSFMGATVLIEPISGPKPYPLRTADDAARVVNAVRASGHTNVGILMDLFHLANNGDDIDAAIDKFASLTSHVQVADWPGRGEPGSGNLEFDRYLRAIASHGYTGWIGLEYHPTIDTDSSLTWLPRERRGALEEE